MIKKIKLELLLFGLLFLSIFVSYNIDIGLYNEDDRFRAEDLNSDYLDSLSKQPGGSITIPTSIL